MSDTFEMIVNGRRERTSVEPDTPLLNRSCATPVSAANGEQAAQCGYCINGWIMTAAELLERNPHATDAEIRLALSGLKPLRHAHEYFAGYEARASEGAVMDRRDFLKTHKRNDYLIDREAQKARRSFSGVMGISIQDAAMQEHG